MTTDVIEGEAREVTETGVTVIESQSVERLDETATPEGMVALAARMATALADIVEQKQLYAVIQKKKYPMVEAWMTIGRMDNVAAREVRGGITRVEGGGFEAEVELIRLTDGMTVGYGSAMCGTPGDTPWSTRPIHVQRSMAVTRATSRAFRQRYSWIMALAGYEPTPADEMPHEARDVSPVRDDPDPEPMQHSPDGLIGSVEKGKSPVDMETRQTPDGPAWGFKLAQGRKGFQALAHGPLAEALAVSGLEEGTRVTVWGRIEEIGWEKDGKKMPPYLRVHIERVQTPSWTLPSMTIPADPVEAESEPLFVLDDDERAAIAGRLPA